MLEKLFFNILDCTYLLPAFLILLFNKKALHQKIFAALFLYSILFFILLYIDPSIPGKYRKIFYQSYTFFEYSFFAFLLFANIKNWNFKRLILIASVLFYLFQIIYYFNFKFRGLDTIPIGIETVLIFIYTFLYLYEYFNNNDQQNINQDYFFWVITGIVFYLASSFFFYILRNNLSREQMDKYWYISYFFDMAKNILFAIAVIIYAKKHLKKQEQKLPDLDYK
jgi:hypothetical protein